MNTFYTIGDAPIGEWCRRAYADEYYAFKFSSATNDTIEANLNTGKLYTRGPGFIVVQIPSEILALELDEILAWAMIRGQM